MISNLSQTRRTEGVSKAFVDKFNLSLKPTFVEEVVSEILTPHVHRVIDDNDTEKINNRTHAGRKNTESYR